MTLLDGRARGIRIPTSNGWLVLLPLTSGGRHGDGSIKYALIDEADYALVKDRKWQAQWNWTNRSFYAKTRSDPPHRRKLILHRVLLGLTKREQHADHRNHITLDNRRSNLRVATVSQSGCNRRVRRDNQSGFRGVNSERGKWRARITSDGKLRTIGYFPTPEAAAAAYDSAAIELHGEFARTNTL